MVNKEEKYKPVIEFYRNHFEEVATKVIPKLPLDSPILIKAWTKMFRAKKIPKKLTHMEKSYLAQKLEAKPKILTWLDLAMGESCCAEMPIFPETQKDGFYGMTHLVGGYTAHMKENKDGSTSIFVKPKNGKMFFLRKV